MSGDLALLERATLLRLSSLLLQPPRVRELAALAAAAPDELRPRALALAERFARDDAEAEYHRLLGASGACRDCESDYGPPALAAKACVAEVAGYYEAFGFAGARELPAPRDQAGLELSFAGYLSLKEAYARRRGGAEEEAVAREGYARFVALHLAPFIGELLAALEERAGAGSLYAEAAAFARAALARCAVLA